MLNIILGLVILVLMFITPLATLIIVGELFKMHKSVDTLSKICAIIVIVEIIFEVLLLLYLIGNGIKM